MPTSTQVSVVLFLALASAAAQTDRVVGGSAPGSYATIAAALTAANPGDRILVASSAYSVLNQTLTITKSVTIQSAPGTRQNLGLIGDTNFGSWIQIQALTPGIPLVFRGIDFTMSEMSGNSRGIRTSAHVAGAVHFEDVHCLYLRGIYNIGGTAMVDLDVDEVWCRGSSFTANDHSQDSACMDTQTREGVDAMRVRATRLVLEDCSLHAGSAIYFMSHSTNCFGDCTSLYTSSGRRGGAALQANTAMTMLTRCSLSDGSGSNSQPRAQPCGSMAIPGAAGASSLTGATGTLFAYQTMLQAGLPGAYFATMPIPTPRGATTNLGSATAPLAVGGTAAPGAGVNVQIGALPPTAGACFLVLSLQWANVPTPFGSLAVDPGLSNGIEFVVPPLARSLPVPNLPEFRFVRIVAQVAWLDPSPVLGNASGIWLDLR